jgi:hypothetical protein
MRSRNDLFLADPKIEAFPQSGGTWKPRRRYREPGDECPGVSPEALLREVLPGHFNAVRADEEINVPVVIPREEVAARTHAEI